MLGNVVFPLELRHEKKGAAEKLACKLLKLVGLSDKVDRYPSQLSGGQQHVAVARALANNPSIMLCDGVTTAPILKLLKDINEELDMTMVVITRSLAVAQKICNHNAVIDEGRIVEEGFTADVFSNPQSPVTRDELAGK